MVNRQNKMEKNYNEPERKQLLFEELINRMEKVQANHQELTSRAYNRTVKIAGNERPLEERKIEQRNESLISYIHSILDRMDRTNDVLGCVVSDLENSIP